MYTYTRSRHVAIEPSPQYGTYGIGHMQRRTCEQILSEHSCYHQAHASSSAVVIVLLVPVVVRALASPATTLDVVSTYVNNVKIIASFNFHMIPGII